MLLPVFTSFAQMRLLSTATPVLNVWGTTVFEKNKVGKRRDEEPQIFSFSEVPSICKQMR
jgi:hypothetical protein